MATTQNTYELTYIVNSVISDEQVKDLISRITADISEAGGEIIEVDEWGQRRLAYPIQKKRNGYYVNMYFRSTGTIVPRLERALEIDDNVLRYMTLRMDAKMIRHYEESKTRRAAILAADPTLPSDNDDDDED
jgi:small subunit ribosomal protein S6